MKCATLCILIWFVSVKGSAQNCISATQQQFISSGSIKVIGLNEAICVRCLDPDNMFIIPSDIQYLNSDGVAIMNNTNNIVITDDGLLLEDPLNSFTNGESFQCKFGSKTYEITVNHIDLTPPTITSTGDTLTYTEGNNITLTCSGDIAEINERYQWALPDGSVTPDNPAQSGASTLTLVYNDVDRTQRGVYTCTVSVTDVTVTEQTNVILDIQFPAAIVSFTPDNSTATANSTLTLNCTYEGNPSPNVLWYHNGSELVDIENDPNLSETIVGSSSLLEVTFANINISGEYTCEVNNSIDDIDDMELVIQFSFLTPTPSLTSSSSVTSDVSSTSSSNMNTFSIQSSKGINSTESSSITLSITPSSSSSSESNGPNSLLSVVVPVVVSVVLAVIALIVIIVVVIGVVYTKHSKNNIIRVRPMSQEKGLEMSEKKGPENNIDDSCTH